MSAKLLSLAPGEAVLHLLPNAGLDDREVAGRPSRGHHGQWRVLLVLLALGGSTADGLRGAAGATVPVTQVVTASPPVAAASIRSAWQYFDSVDPLDGEVTHHANLTGNPPGADGPADAGTLDITSTARYGARILIVFPRVRTACGHAACQVRIAWDHAAPAPYPYQDLSGDAETTLQPLDSDRFLAAMAAAHDMTLTAAFGMQHDYRLTFTVAGFDPAMMR
jgi:hypothetical protein